MMPCVLDARDRVTPGITAPDVREVVGPQLHALARSLQARDRTLVQFHVRGIGSILAAYRASGPSTTRDGAEVSAIQLCLNAVTLVAGGDYVLPVNP